MENKHLWKRYDLERELMAERHGRSLEKLPYETKRDWLVQKLHLAEDINEVLPPSSSSFWPPVSLS